VEENGEGEEEEESEYECGGCWVIGSVEVEDEFEDCEEVEECELFEDWEIVEHVLKTRMEEINEFAEENEIGVHQAAEEMTEVIMSGGKEEMMREMRGWKTEKRKTRNQRKRESRRETVGKPKREIKWKTVVKPASSGRFEALREEEEEEEKTDICAVEEKTEEEITVDSGAGKCVWPRTRKEGGKVTKLQRNIRLSAANGQEMKVDGEKVIKFETDGRRCAMKFLVTDTKKPLAAVSAIVDEGNVVVFGPGPWGSFIQNVTSGEKIFLQRKKGTYVMKVTYEGAPQKPKDDGGNRPMDIGSASEVGGKKVRSEAPVFTGRK
jgi:hypothetical protein